MHWLDPSFRKLIDTHHALELDTTGTWVESLAMIAEADVVITRFGGMSIMAASVGTPVIEIPKPEPTMWASPIYSHPNQGHVVLLPEHRCAAFEGSPEHRMNPCSVAWAEYRQEHCVLNHPKRDLPDRDSFHCWRQVTVDQVISQLNKRDFKNAGNTRRSVEH
jgi:ADP-heptose:LPS heptosyltransferase